MYCSYKWFYSILTQFPLIKLLLKQILLPWMNVLWIFGFEKFDNCVWRESKLHAHAFSQIISYRKWRLYTYMITLPVFTPVGCGNHIKVIMQHYVLYTLFKLNLNIDIIIVLCLNIYLKYFTILNFLNILFVSIYLQMHCFHKCKNYCLCNKLQ